MYFCWLHVYLVSGCPRHLNLFSCTFRNSLVNITNDKSVFTHDGHAETCLRWVPVVPEQNNKNTIKPMIYFSLIVKSTQISSWNQPVLSNEGKVSC